MSAEVEGPGAVLHGPRYVIAVPDLDRSERYYAGVLGCRVHHVGDPGWRFFIRDKFYVMAGECRGATPADQLGDHSYIGYVEVDGIDDFYASLAGKDVDFLKPLRNEPWGMREFGIRTVDGHRFMFGYRLG